MCLDHVLNATVSRVDALQQRFNDGEIDRVVQPPPITLSIRSVRNVSIEPLRFFQENPQIVRCPIREAGDAARSQPVQAVCLARGTMTLL